MERIPSKSSIDIRFDSICKKTFSKTPKIYSEIEGSLKILIDNKLIFNEEGILLGELYLNLKKWLKFSGKEPVSFTYESMDYEDGPILAFQKSGPIWKVSSVWCRDLGSFSFDLNEIIKAAVNYTESLEKTIPEIVQS